MQTEPQPCGKFPRMTVTPEFEEHCFECPECALDLEAAVKFVANARVVFQADPTT